MYGNYLLNSFTFSSNKLKFLKSRKIIILKKYITGKMYHCSTQSDNLTENILKEFAKKKQIKFIDGDKDAVF